MLSNYIIPADREKPYIPQVDFRTDGTFKIIGSSFMENPFDFYDAILEWVEDFIKTKQSVNLHLLPDYFNTSSTKCIDDLLNILGEYAMQGNDVQAYWYHQEDDFDSLDEGEDYKSILST